MQYKPSEGYCRDERSTDGSNGKAVPDEERVSYAMQLWARLGQLVISETSTSHLTPDASSPVELPLGYQSTDSRPQRMGSSNCGEATLTYRGICTVSPFQQYDKKRCMLLAYGI